MYGGVRGALAVISLSAVYSITWLAFFRKLASVGKDILFYSFGEAWMVRL